MEFEGHVAGGVIVLDGNAALPEGTRVQIVPLAAPEPTLADKFKNVIGKATSLPSDMASQHDHYIHGSPKR
ncbi:MAG TPA: hypothetical protein VGI40_27580 [Pirellulaceae bacterium]|jgi:hypothetical protein